MNITSIRQKTDADHTVIKFLLFFCGVPFALLIAKPIHELGHATAAMLLGGDVLDVDLWRYVNARIPNDPLSVFILKMGGVTMEYLVIFPALYILDHYRLAIAHIIRGYFYLMSCAYLVSVFAPYWTDSSVVEGMWFCILACGFFAYEFERMLDRKRQRKTKYGYASTALCRLL